MTLARTRTRRRRHEGAGSRGVLVACPDSRPPAYQAVAGLAGAGLLGEFLTGFYDRGDGLAGVLGRSSPRLARAFRKRKDPAIPSALVRSAWSFDVALALENRGPRFRARVARWRTRHFDRLLAREVDRLRPDALLVFSDVGTDFALPRCRELGVPIILSVVHGEVHEEVDVLEREAALSPEFQAIYLGDGRLDRDELAWFHDRRRREAALADRVLVPSEHIAEAYARHGTPADRIKVVPYAADTRRFTPRVEKRHDHSCTFLFAGGITQRKGISYLLKAWREAKRPGRRLRLLGALPNDATPLAPWLDDVEILGRLPHADVPAVMAEADVFVFPSLFEGSAVVTYEALASGLPLIVTDAAGSVARDGVEAIVVPSANVEALVEAMDRLAEDPARRSAMSRAARLRAEAFDWPRYHEALVNAVEGLIAV